jgi:hypothetical protein
LCHFTNLAAALFRAAIIVKWRAAFRGFQFCGSEKKEGFSVSSVHYKLSIIKRGEGKSTVAAAAYRAAERIYNHRTGLWHDFTDKGGVVHSEIMLPDHAPEMYQDRAILWNSVEHKEKAKNAQLSRHLEVGLPVELDRADQIALIRDHIQTNFVDRGMCADFCVHDKGDGNPHVHIMFTLRPIHPDGTWGEKSRKEYVLDRHGQKVPLEKGGYKSNKISLTGWDEQGNAEMWRQAWAREVNREYERLGLEPRIDLRSYARQGLDLEPTRHLGPAAAQMEKKGKASYLGDINREIEGRNAQRERGRHIRNLDERNYTQRPQREEQARERLPSYEEWLEGHKKEQSRGLERGR